jgi:hypothetical protein
MKYIILAMFFAMNINAMHSWNELLENIEITLCTSEDQVNLSTAVTSFTRLVKQLKKEGVELSLVRTTANNSLLHIAVMFGNKQLAMSLIKDGIDVNCLGAKSKTALMLAAEEGDAGMCELLISLGANLYCVSDDNQTVFRCMKRKSKAEKFLVSLQKYEPSDNAEVVGPQKTIITETMMQAIDEHWENGDHMLLPAFIEQKAAQGILADELKANSLMGRTPLQYALLHHRFEASRLILLAMLQEDILPERDQVNNMITYVARNFIWLRNLSLDNEAIKASAAYAVLVLLKNIGAFHLNCTLAFLPELAADIIGKISELSCDCYENSCLRDSCQLRKRAKNGILEKCRSFGNKILKKK